MRKLIAISLLLTGIACSSRHAQKRPATTGTNLVLYGRGLYPGDDTTFDLIRQSGFTTLMLSSFYIKANGDLVSGDDGRHPIIHNGEFTGSEEWVKRIKAVKNGGSIRRTEILLEGRWYGQPPNTYDYIRDWIDSNKADPAVTPGTDPGSTLYKMMKVLKEKLGADAICIDDESVYDSLSIIKLGKMVRGLGMRMTLCPYTRIPFWKSIIDSSSRDVVDAVYLQCYDGGKNNTMGPWAQGLQQAVPIYPIFLCRGAFSRCSPSHNSKTPEEIRTDMLAFKKEYPAMKGGGIWQMADIKAYVQMNCAVKDTTSGTAASVREYLQQLRRSLEQEL